MNQRRLIDFTFWRPAYILALIALVCCPAFAFDDSGLPTVSDTTAIALKNYIAAPINLAVPYASATIFDATAPAVGSASSPSFGSPTGVPVTYSGMTDLVSGLKATTLWVRLNDGGWASSGQSLATESGTLTFNPYGVEGTYYFAFRLEDKAGNLSPVPSGLGLTSSKADGTPPVITLNGSASMSVAKDAIFTDPGASATDAVEGDLTSRIVVTGSVNTSQAGTYTLRYNVADSAGNAAPEVTRTVTVQGPIAFSLSIPTGLQGQVGATILCPINIAQAEGLTSYKVTILFDGSLLAVSKVSSGTTTGTWRTPKATIGSGSVSVSSSGAPLRAGSGSIAVISMTVKEGAQSGQTSSLNFISATLNDGAAQVSTQNGLFTVNNDTYLYGDVNGDGTVDDTDAVYVLIGRSGKVRLISKADDVGDDGAYLGVGDVSGDEPPSIGTVDASLIMRYSQGLIGSFPVDLDGDGMGPELTSEKTVAKAAVLLDYGDPSQTKRLVSIPGKIKLEPGATYQIPVSVNLANVIRGYYFELLYDSRALEYVNTSSGSLTQDWISPIVNPLTGKVIVVGAGAEEISGEGALAVLTFRALPSVTSGAATWLKLDAAELNDGLLLSEQSTGMGEPVISAVEPKTGAETGGTVVRISGANLGDVSRVVFGNAESPWVRVDATGSVLLALTPAGGGAVNVTVESPAGASTLTRGFTYFLPQVHLTMTPEDVVESGSPVDIPVWIVDLSGGHVSTVTFDVRFDPAVFTAKPAGGTLATAEESALLANKAVTATLAGPGILRVTISGSPAKSIGSGLLVTCHLLAIANEEEAQGLIHITNTLAQSAEAKSLPASASLVSQ